MSTLKLTLTVPEKILAEAKVYSKRSGQSLSRLVSRYLAVLSGSLRVRNGEADQVTPRVRQITGLAKGTESEKEILFQALSHKYK